MKRILIFICILNIFTFTSCNNTDTGVNEPETNEIATSTERKQINEEILQHIEELEKEIIYLKDKIDNKDRNIKDNFGVIFNALCNSDSSNGLFISMDYEEEHVVAVHVKVPKETNSYDFFILTGYEVNGVPYFDCLIQPAYTTSDNPQNISIDTEKYSLYKLMPGNLEYYDTSIMLIIALHNSSGNEYSDFLNSQRLSKDI